MLQTWEKRKKSIPPNSLCPTCSSHAHLRPNSHSLLPACEAVRQRELSERSQLHQVVHTLCLGPTRSDNYQEQVVYAMAVWSRAYGRRQVHSNAITVSVPTPTPIVGKPAFAYTPLGTSTSHQHSNNKIYISALSCEQNERVKYLLFRRKRGCTFFFFFLRRRSLFFAGNYDRRNSSFRVSFWQ